VQEKQPEKKLNNEIQKKESENLDILTLTNAPTLSNAPTIL